MKSERIYSAIGAADDELLIQLEASRQKGKNNSWLRWGAIAACFFLVIIGAVIVNYIYHTGQNLPAEGMVISAYETEVSTSGSYAVPERGTWFYFVDVAAALEEYADQEVTYLLAFDIFPNEGTSLTNESDEMKAELERLTGLGYEVGYIEKWTYQGQGEQVYYHVSAGYFTAEQLESFSASLDYGYAFHFIANGDGTPVDAQQELITEYSFGDGFNVQ